MSTPSKGILKSIRHGFATNSSSSHSIVWDPNRTFKDRRTISGRYNCEWFLLLDPESKKDYFLSQLFGDLMARCPALGEEFIISGIEGVFKEEIQPEYVDHQSQWKFPSSVGSFISEGKLNWEFAKELLEAMSDDRVIIEGGNDNDSYPGRTSDLDPFIELQGGVARKSNGHWTIFYPGTGGKFRYDLKGRDIFYADTPELVDLKITDYCSYGCKFCYQGSTEQGVHAQAAAVISIIRTLKDLEVFEIAIGGGEPTAHPNFVDFLCSIKKAGIVPNFTTFDLEYWSKDKIIVEAVNHCCGGFAVSSLSANSLKAVAKWNKSNKVKANLQIPCGAYPKAVVQRAINFAKENFITITFLGYKNTHRGANNPPKDYSWIFQELLKHSWELRWGADTLFVKQFKNEMDAAGIDRRLRVGEEGMFSCYIDAVEGTIDRSSYEVDDTYKKKFELTGPYGNTELEQLVYNNFPFVER